MKHIKPSSISCYNSSFIHFFFILSFILSFQFASAQIIYVSPSGTGDGTRNNPADIRNAFENLSSDGSHLRLATGIYNIDTVLDISNDNMIIEGGFDINNKWVKTSDALATVIRRSNQNVAGNERQMRLVAVSAIEIDNLHMQNLKIEVADAPTTLSYGISTYGLYLNDCTDYKIVSVYVEGGKASGGADGTVLGVDGINGYDGRRRGR